MTIQAIPTRWAGCHFRSRLEARWAVFFDELRIRWEYEPEGFEVGIPCDEEHENATHEDWCHQTQKYLPDFFLPESETWVEVKGNDQFLDRTLLTKATDWGHGLPGTANSLRSTRGLLVLGPIPRPDRWPFHAILQHGKGVYLTLAFFVPGGIQVSTDWRSEEWFGDSSTDSYDYKGPLCDLDLFVPTNSVPTEVARAYAAARSARFEHGDREVW